MGLLAARLDRGLQGVEVAAHGVLEQQAGLVLPGHPFQVEHVGDDLVAGRAVVFLAVGDDQLVAVEHGRRGQSFRQARGQQLDGHAVGVGDLGRHLQVAVAALAGRVLGDEGQHLLAGGGLCTGYGHRHIGRHGRQAEHGTHQGECDALLHGLSPRCSAALGGRGGISARPAARQQCPSARAREAPCQARRPTAGDRIAQRAAETGAGQHGVATATAAALLGLECVIYMGEEDTKRQALNVARMKLLGATVVPVTTGSKTLKDAINEAMRDWVANVHNTHYLFGTVAGPAPFPELVREFHRIIGDEAREQVLERFGRLPDAVAACVGGGSNAIGIFTAFVNDKNVRLVGMEAAGDGVETGRHASSITGGTVGVLHGARTFVLQDDDGQTIESHSISAGLDYPGVGPEHAYLADIGRAQYVPITDSQAMDAFKLLCETEGIIPAIETAHALAGAIDLGKELGPGALILVNLSGRGDKDVETAAKWFGIKADS